MKKDMAYWNAVGMRDGYAGNYNPPVGPFEHILDLGAWGSGYKEGRAARIADGIGAELLNRLNNEISILRQRLEELEKKA